MCLELMVKRLLPPLEKYLRVLGLVTTNVLHSRSPPSFFWGNFSFPAFVLSCCGSLLHLGGKVTYMGKHTQFLPEDLVLVFMITETDANVIQDFSKSISSNELQVAGNLSREDVGLWSISRICSSWLIFPATVDICSSQAFPFLFKTKKKLPLLLHST